MLLFADLTATSLGVATLALFAFAYLLVMAEEWLGLRKCKPVLLCAGASWVLVSFALGPEGHTHEKLKHHLGEYAELMLFLTVAMAYVTAIAERNVFLALNAWLLRKGYSLRGVFWITGGLAFVMSPLCDNMTTALLLGAVVLAVGRGEPRFVSASCVNLVVAANAGGAFSPFGDITTLMVWAEGKAHTLDFFRLVPASLVNWLVPAACMHFTIPRRQPQALTQEAALKPGAITVCLLFAATIATAVMFHAAWHLPPFLGMTTGFGYYMFWSWARQRGSRRKDEGLDVFRHLAATEWDTLLFFGGVLLSVGALQELGWLAKLSDWLYGTHSTLTANVAVGLASAVIDNVPVMYAILRMDPAMGVSDWLLVTLTAGVGGSLLSVGSAAGVALMGAAHGVYTFVSHLRWAVFVAVGYVASVVVQRVVG